MNPASISNMDAYGDSLSRQIFDTARLHRKHAGSLLAEIGLYVGQENVLKVLGEGGRTMGELATALGVQAPTVTKMVTRLVAAGFVERHSVLEDARQGWVTLTHKGRRQARLIDGVLKTLDEQAFRGFSEGDRERLKDLLGRVWSNLDEVDVPEVEEVAA